MHKQPKAISRRGAWQNLLCAEVTDLAEPSLLQSRLDDLNAELGAPTMRLLHHRKRSSMREELATARSGSALSVGITYTHLVLAAHHRHLDGLGLLAALSRLSGHPIISSVEPLPEPSDEVQMAHRRRLTPPAPVAFAHYRNDLSFEVFADIEVSKPVREAQLMAALARATKQYNGRRGVDGAHLQITHSGFTAPGSAPSLGTASALVSLPDVESAGPAALGRMLRSRPQEPVTAIGSRRRRTSSLLHAGLGTISSPTCVRSIEFYPAAGHAFGVAIGASTQQSRTIITARSRAARHTAQGLRELLELVRIALS